MKMPRLLMAPVLLLILTSLAGCITVGHEFPYKRVGDIRIGETTLDDIRAQFGNPVRTGVEDGKLVWSYVHFTGSVFGDFEGRDLTVKFDNRNRVMTYNYSTTDPTEKLNLDR